MKKIVFISAAIIMASCSLDRKEDFDVDYAIGFQPAMYMHAAPSDMDTYPAEQDFGVSAWSLPEGLSWADDCSEAQDYLSMCCASCDEDGSWSLKEDAFWPSKEERLTILAYSPYEAACTCDKKDGIVWTDVDITRNKTDLLFTEPLQDLSKMDCGGTVTLPFKHALCLVDFRVKHHVGDEDKITVKKIVIDEVHNSGSFRSLAEPAWVLNDSMASLMIYEGNYVADALPVPIGREWMVIPQALDTQVTVEYEYAHPYGGHLEMKLKTVPLLTRLISGQRYTFTLTIGIDDVKFLTELIEDRID